MTRILAILLLLATFAGRAQFPAPLPPDEHEDEAVTVAKCLEDLASGELNSRRRAVLVLGKYPDNARALAAVIDALDDDQASVRRSAVVALIEDRIHPAAVEPLWHRLTDADVQVRRLVSSNLPRLLLQSRLRIMIGGTPAPATGLIPEALTAPTRAAFRDEDAAVRRNMAAHWRECMTVLDAELVAALLADPERDVRIRAVEAAPRFLDKRELVDRLEPLAEDPDRLIRLQVADTLADAVRRVPQATDILDTLRQDADFEIATRAGIGLLGAGRGNVLDGLLGKLSDPRLDADSIIEILRHLPRQHPADARERIIGLTTHERPTVRAGALQVFSWHYPDTATDDRLLAWLNDPAAAVREVALRLTARRRELAPDFLQRLAASPHPDVRRQVLQLSRKLDGRAAADLLFELVIDDDEDIRLAALTSYGRRRLPGWRDLLLDSLADPSEAVFATALEALLSGKAEAATITALRERSETLTDARRQAVQAHLQVRKVLR